jgi:uncharacterized membrane protein YdjX (TVP38/TMEM64 family)
MRWFVIVLTVVLLIVVPFLLFEGYFTELADRVARGEGSRWTVALGLGALLGTDVLLPIPSSIVSAAAGVLLGFWKGAATVWAGMSVSCLVGYLIGARSSHAARRFVGDVGLARAAALADRFGYLAIVLCRPVPVLAEATVILAGVVKAPMSRVLAVSLAANLGVAAGYAAIGAYSMRVDSFLLAFLGSLAVPGLALLAGKVWLADRKQP